ncbi:uncharacterized protein J3R85_014716 [Psidium guajava]|nr:uncharacterized protein J3R85_014716 [Psidium guajava]
MRAIEIVENWGQCSCRSAERSEITQSTRLLTMTFGARTRVKDSRACSHQNCHFVSTCSNIGEVSNRGLAIDFS